MDMVLVGFLALLLLAAIVSGVAKKRVSQEDGPYEETLARLMPDEYRAYRPLFEMQNRMQAFRLH